MSQPSRIPSDPSTTPRGFVVVGLTEDVRSITATIIGRRKAAGKNGPPSNLQAASRRADVMSGKAKPVEILMRLDYADLDDGVDLELVNQYLRERIEQNRQYAARKAARRERSGLLSFRTAYVRVHARETLAQGMADIRSITVDENSVESIDAALIALNKYDEPQEAMKALLIEQKMKLLAAR